MRTTTNYGWSVPNADADPDAVPTHLGGLADDVDAIMAGWADGSYATMTGTTAKRGQLWFVNTGGTKVNTLWRGNADGSWSQVSLLPGASGSVTTAGFGDTPVAGATTDQFSPIDHKHGMPTNPVTPHVAASNPHPALWDAVATDISKSSPTDAQSEGALNLAARADHVHGRLAGLAGSGYNTFSGADIVAAGTIDVAYPFPLEIWCLVLMTFTVLATAANAVARIFVNSYGTSTGLGGCTDGQINIATNGAFNTLTLWGILSPQAVSAGGLALDVETLTNCKLPIRAPDGIDFGQVFTVIPLGS